jgi:hypothetical protein
LYFKDIPALIMAGLVLYPDKSIKYFIGVKEYPTCIEGEYPVSFSSDKNMYPFCIGFHATPVV